MAADGNSPTECGYLRDFVFKLEFTKSPPFACICINTPSRDFASVRRPWINWFPLLRLCGRCRNLWTTITFTRCELPLHSLSKRRSGIIIKLDAGNQPEHNDPYNLGRMTSRSLLAAILPSFWGERTEDRVEKTLLYLVVERPISNVY